MSVLLYVVGAIATMLGVAMIGYGIPINEFSFGNTLIIAGTTAAAGGLVIIGIAAAVGRLQRIAEALTTGVPVRSGRPLEMFEPPGGSRAPAGKVPFPPRPKSESGVHEPQLSLDAPAADDMAVASRATPTLRNPDMPAVEVGEYRVEEYEEDVLLSPQQPVPAPASSDHGKPVPTRPVGGDTFPIAEKRPESGFDAAWRFAQPASHPPERQPQTDYFDAMWPAEAKPAKRPVVDEPKPEPPPSAKASAPQAPNSYPASEPPAAILKSGVVDGMGYTLYVDGSIEAELPQGTLRFASINELRDHLAKNP
jgi:hypothetical protein